MMNLLSGIVIVLCSESVDGLNWPYIVILLPSLSAYVIVKFSPLLLHSTCLALASTPQNLATQYKPRLFVDAFIISCFSVLPTRISKPLSHLVLPIEATDYLEWIRGFEPRSCLVPRQAESTATLLHFDSRWCARHPPQSLHLTLLWYSCYPFRLFAECVSWYDNLDRCCQANLLFVQRWPFEQVKAGSSTRFVHICGHGCLRLLQGRLRCSKDTLDNPCFQNISC